MEFAEFVDRVAEMTGATREENQDPESDEVMLRMELGGHRHQEVVAYPFQEDGRSYVRFYTPIGKRGDVPRPMLTTALELNASLTHGAFAIYEGRIALLDTMELDGVNPEEGARILRYLGRMADSFEKMAFGVDRS